MRTFLKIKPAKTGVLSLSNVKTIELYFVKQGTFANFQSKKSFLGKAKRKRVILPSVNIAILGCPPHAT